MRPASLALAVALAALSCSPRDTPSCPGTPLAVFRFKGPLVLAGDPRLAGRDPVPAILDCTPDPADASAPVRYPPLVSFDGRLAEDPATDAAALCRPNGAIYEGTRDGAAWNVEAVASPAVLCSSACEASMRVVVAGDVAVDGGGAPTSFDGALLEILTAERGACDACLPLVPGADPPERACAARYALSGALR